jgi:non-ribosomal peptide synthetase component E (peptide arylation enzyme)
MTNNKMQPEADDPSEQFPRDQGKPLGPDERQTRRESESEPSAAGRPGEKMAGRRPLFRN